MIRPSVSVLRRTALAVSLLGAAGLGVGAASAAAGGGSASPHVPPCATSQLRVWYGEPGDAAAGSSYYELQFSNVSSTTCNLYGYPGVSAVSSSGAQLGSPASWDHSVTPSYVILTPGSTSHVVLRIADVYNYPTSECSPVAAVGLRIYPPNQKASTDVPISFEACSKTAPIYLTVRPVTAGAGIPGYSS